jgi:alkyl sulfatase BDS1-like metallo-beta-lactamase superfamily hydrolase
MAQLPRLPGAMLLDSLSVRLNGPKVGAATLALHIRFSDLGDETYLLEVENAVLRHHQDRTAPGAPTATLNRPTLVALVTGAKTVEAALADGSLSVEGDASVLSTFLGWLDRFDFWFEIIEP